MNKKIVPILIGLLLFCQQIYCQDLISGNVIRQSKKPFPGVKVSVEGSPNIEVTTDMLGNFDIEVPTTAKLLVFSYEGMLTQKIGLGKKSFIKVTMIEGKDEPPKPVVKKDEKPKKPETEKSKKPETEKSKKPETEKPKESTKPKKESKPKVVTPSDSTTKTVKENKPKNVKQKEEKPKDNNKDKEKAKKPKLTKESEPVSDTVEVEQPKPTKEKKPVKEKEEKPKKEKKSK